MGNLAPFDMLIAMSAVEAGLKHVGYEFLSGTGVAAVQSRIARSI
jgi:aspartate aminotransferase-like enzyme